MHRLSEEIVQHILYYAVDNISDTMRLRCVSKKWRGILEHNTFWSMGYPKALPPVKGYGEMVALSTMRAIKEERWTEVTSVFGVWLVLVQDRFLGLSKLEIFSKLPLELQKNVTLFSELLRYDCALYYNFPSILKEDPRVRVTALRVCSEEAYGDLEEMYEYMWETTQTPMFNDRDYALEMLSRYESIYENGVVPQKYLTDKMFMAEAVADVGKDLVDLMKQNQDALLSDAEFTKVLSRKLLESGYKSVEVMLKIKEYFHHSVFEDRALMWALLDYSGAFQSLLPEALSQDPDILQLIRANRQLTP